ncbi:MAG: hypothetical protein Q4B48_04355, partial [Syntrophomonadaceae bacterium]|nr:hypothetical protein [Syntrophomonadaceae bacterium]
EPGLFLRDMDRGQREEITRVEITTYHRQMGDSFPFTGRQGRGKPISEVRNEIHKALLIGMRSQDASVQAYWLRIPHEGDIPTPEEVILFLAYGAKPRM